MNQEPGVWKREPVRIIGLVVALAMAIIQVLTGEGIIDTNSRDQAENLVNSLQSIALIVAPLIVSEISRTRVTPTAAPKLPVNTPVLADRPEGDEPPPDLVVVDRRSA